MFFRLPNYFLEKAGHLRPAFFMPNFLKITHFGSVLGRIRPIDNCKDYYKPYTKLNFGILYKIYNSYNYLLILIFTLF